MNNITKMLIEDRIDMLEHELKRYPDRDRLKENYENSIKHIEFEEKKIAMLKEDLVKTK